MIRFILGLILVMGSVGAIDADAAILPAMVVAGAGFALMLWSLNSFPFNGGAIQ